MITDLTEIKNYCKDKNICLLGNARSVLNTQKNIDQYDIIGRMNHGLPKGKEKFIGSRTDILFSSTRLSNSEILQFHSKYMVWMTASIKRLPEYLHSCTIQNPPEDWQELKDKYSKDKLPSTGCIVINFLLKHIEFNSLTIYGFDHFLKSGTHYHNLKNQIWHNGEFEKELITSWIKNRQNMKIIYE